MDNHHLAILMEAHSSYQCRISIQTWDDLDNLVQLITDQVGDTRNIDTGAQVSAQVSEQVSAQVRGLLIERGIHIDRAQKVLETIEKSPRTREEI